MDPVLSRNVPYEHAGTRMLGLLRAPATPATAPGQPAVLAVHDAFGVTAELVAAADRLVALGHPVLLADVWGERRLPASEQAVGPLIGGMVGDRDRWLGRVRAAHATAAALPEFAGRPLVLLGWCFGGSSVLEHLRTGADVAGVVSVHAGLDLLAPDWSAARPTPVLVCTGSADPMATSAMRTELTAELTAAGMDWQLHLYGGAKHAFTSPRSADSPAPDVVAYDPRAAARAWEATVRFLREVAQLQPAH